MTRKLKLGPFTYTVKENSGLIMDGLQGLMRRGQSVIEINPLQPKDHYRDTILHETLHACWEQAALPAGDPESCEDLEEEVIRRITPWLLMALRDNRWLTELLQER